MTNDWFARAEARIPGGVNSPVRAFGSVGGGDVELAHVTHGMDHHGSGGGCGGNRLLGVEDVPPGRRVEMVQGRYGAVDSGEFHVGVDLDESGPEGGRRPVQSRGVCDGRVGQGLNAAEHQVEERRSL